MVLNFSYYEYSNYFYSKNVFVKIFITFVLL